MYDVGAYSRYWSSTPYDAELAYCVYFFKNQYASNLYAKYSYSRNGGFPVRLVCPVESAGGSEEPSAAAWDGDLSKLTADATEDYATATDGMTIFNTLPSGVNVKVSIADGATVTLKNAVINGTNNSSYKWAGLTLAGDATIILDGENMVKGFYDEYPGIHVPSGKTLTIKGDGTLNASSNSWGAGIGGGYHLACGNITIEDGTITATGGTYAAGIGGGSSALCGKITITGGTVTATGGNNAAGIGGCNNAACGTITITDGVTSVTATKGSNAPNSIGAGAGAWASCGTVTIGGIVTGSISESPYTYDPNSIVINGDGAYNVQSGETWQHFIQRQDNSWMYDCMNMFCDSYGVAKDVSGVTYDLYISNDGGTSWTQEIFTSPSSPVDCTKKYKWVIVEDSDPDQDDPLE